MHLDQKAKTIGFSGLFEFWNITNNVKGEGTRELIIELKVAEWTLDTCARTNILIFNVASNGRKDLERARYLLQEV